MKIQQNMSLMEKLTILSDAAKYDVACTSSGVDRGGDGIGLGNSISCGICHTFSADGRCVSLLKILFTNECIFNCTYWSIGITVTPSSEHCYGSTKQHDNHNNQNRYPTACGDCCYKCFGSCNNRFDCRNSSFRCGFRRFLCRLNRFLCCFGCCCDIINL